MRRLKLPLTNSLLVRVLLVEALTFFAACVTLPLLAISELEASATHIQAELLTGQAQALARDLYFDRRQGWALRPDGALHPIFDSGYDGRAYAIVDSAHRVALASRFAQPGLWPAQIYTGLPHRFEQGSVTGISMPVVLAGRRGWLVVTQDQTRPGAVVDDVSRAFLARYAVALIGLLVGMLAVDGILFWHSFRALRRVTGEAGRIAPRSPEQALDERDLPIEIRPLVRAINGLLARVRGALHQQDEFAANVAHELRTPLATLRLRAGAVADPDARAVLLPPIERIDHVLSQLHSLALLEAAAEASMGPVDPEELAVAIVAEMTPRILASGRTIALSGAGVGMRVTGNAVLLGIALRNLIENATLHTPPGTHIEVRLTPPGTVAVIDDGPGIAEDQAPRLLRRFHRADHTRADGAGLGLSIVQRIVEAHGAAFEVDQSPHGGARLRIDFGAA